MSVQNLKQRSKIADRVQKIEQFLFSLFALVSIAFSITALAGQYGGWAKWSKTGLTTKHSPFTNMMELVFEELGQGFHIDPAYLHVVDKQLPNAPFDVTVKLGLYKIRSRIRVHDGEEIPGYIKELALALSPRDDLDVHIAKVMDTRRGSLTIAYDDERKVGRITGIITMSVLAFSTLLALLILIPWSKLDVISEPIKLKACFFGFCFLAVYCVQLVCLIIGCRKDLERNPVVQHAYTPYPDWAWIAAILSSLTWFPIYYLAKHPLSNVLLCFLNLINLNV
eukprot:g4393.t1